MRNFRLSAGVRLERPVPPQPSAVIATYYETGTIPSTLSAAPRIGISYGLDDRTVVLERSLPFQTTLTASYIRISGVHLLTANDLNLTPDVESATYTINDIAGQAVGEYTTDVWTTRSSTTYGHLSEIGNGGSSSYRALSVQLRKPMARSLSFGAAFTWSHAIDNVGGTSSVTDWCLTGSGHREWKVRGSEWRGIS